MRRMPLSDRATSRASSASNSLSGRFLEDDRLVATGLDLRATALAAACFAGLTEGGSAGFFATGWAALGAGVWVRAGVVAGLVVAGLPGCSWTTRADLPAESFRTGGAEDPQTGFAPPRSRAAPPARRRKS